MNEAGIHGATPITDGAHRHRHREVTDLFEQTPGDFFVDPGSGLVHVQVPCTGAEAEEIIGKQTAAGGDHFTQKLAFFIEKRLGELGSSAPWPRNRSCCRGLEVLDFEHDRCMVPARKPANATAKSGAVFQFSHGPPWGKAFLPGRTNREACRPKRPVAGRS